MRFTKMHGIGNDYIYVNAFDETIADPARLAIAISDRHTGVGGDGLILIGPSDKADVRMRMFNADGTESEMCGNGIRCVAKYSYDHGLSRSNPMRVETGRGVLTLDLKIANGKVELVTVNMGAPILELQKIPVDREKLLGEGRWPSSHRFRAGSDEVEAVFVSMGNPHATIFVKELPDFDTIRMIGPKIEHAAVFPRRINVHWVSVQSKNEVTMRTWERGSGITMACGTGACAVLVSGVLTGQTDPKATAHLPGGDLQLEWRKSENTVYMTGPATEVFSGDWKD